MKTPAKLNEFHAAEDPGRRLLERIGWSYVPREALATERDERGAPTGHPLESVRLYSIACAGISETVTALRQREERAR